MHIDRMIERLRALKKTHGNIDVGMRYPDGHFNSAHNVRMIRDFYQDNKKVVGIYSTRTF